MTYPLKVKADAQKVLDAAPARQEALLAALAVAADPVGQDRARKDLATLEQDIAKARDDLTKYADRNTSIVGLEQPLTQLKNPGLFSIPLGFICVVLGSLLYRDPRAMAMWDELYVRQNTGIHAEGAVSH
jgi:cation/acetate symporter